MFVIQPLNLGFWVYVATFGVTLAKQTQAHLTGGRHLMSALFDFMFGTLLGDAETAFTILKNWLIICTSNTQSGFSYFECWGMRPPGDLLKECRCLLSSTTLWNYPDNIISQSLLFHNQGPRDTPCYLHPWWLGLWNSSSNLLSCLEITMTSSSHLYEAKSLETIDNWGKCSSFLGACLSPQRRTHYICFPGFWEVELFFFCFW